MEPTCAIGLPHHRTIVALDIEKSTNRTDSVKAELRNKIYDLFDAALCSARIHRRHRDRFIDRGDGSRTADSRCLRGHLQIRCASRL